MISFLLDSAKTDRDTPAFQYAKKLFQKGTFKRVGILLLENAQYLEISGRDTNNVAPRHLPMLVPPKHWDNRNQKEGCYYRIRSSMMRTNSKSQTEALRRADMGDVLQGLDYLGKPLLKTNKIKMITTVTNTIIHTVTVIFSGQIGWRINKPVFEVIKACYDRKLVIGDLPGKEVTPPSKEECIRIVPQTFYKTIFKIKNIIEDAEVTNLLPEDEHTWDEDKEKEMMLLKELEKEKAEKPSKKIKKKYAPDENHDPLVPRFDERYYNDLCRRTAAKNAALHSIRCDLQLKFWVAEKFKDDTFYFPYNLDFRGRAYPVPPNLNHLGERMCRE